MYTCTSLSWNNAILCLRGVLGIRLASALALALLAPLPAYGQVPPSPKPLLPVFHEPVFFPLP